MGSEQYEALRGETGSDGRGSWATPATAVRDLEERLAEGGSSAGGDDSEYQRRYEMAMDDVREMKERIAGTRTGAS